MKFSTQVKPVSYLKSNAAAIIKEVTENREPMLITQNGEAKLVVMDVRSYEERNSRSCTSASTGRWYPVEIAAFMK
jgi:prevent-host-death family protein